jgi:hypothetical protein
MRCLDSHPGHREKEKQNRGSYLGLEKDKKGGDEEVAIAPEGHVAPEGDKPSITGPS